MFGVLHCSSLYVCRGGSVCVCVRMCVYICTLFGMSQLYVATEDSLTERGVG